MHQLLIVSHEPLAKVRIIPLCCQILRGWRAKKLFVRGRRVDTAHRIIIEGLVVTVLGCLFGDQTWREGAQLSVDVLTHLLFLFHDLLSILVKLL